MEVDDKTLKELNITREQWEEFERQFRALAQVEGEENESLQSNGKNT